MEETFAKLKTRIQKITDIQRAAALIAWDQETYMPVGGAAGRAETMGTLQGMAHEQFTAEETGALLEDLQTHLDDLDYDSDEAAIIRETWRSYEKEVKVPSELQAQMARAQANGTVAWREAREKNDFSIFQPHLETILDLTQQRIDALGVPEGGTRYDVAMDTFERDLTSAYVDEVFAQLRPTLIELTEAITANADAVDRSILTGTFSDEEQMAFSKQIAAAVGYDFNRGRIDTSPHPFTIGMGHGDVRITTRFDKTDPISAIMGTIHEAGHAIYEQNTAESLARTGLDSGAGMATHESQSRFYENVVGRSLPFWRYWYPQLQKALSPHFDEIALEDFYGAMNEVKPTLIRVEADEVTYGLHIMLRYELEKRMINEGLAAAELPELWDDMMVEYLGIRPGTDREGVLQDVHWSQGLIGYFPTYLLGSVLSSQLWEALLTDIEDAEAQIETGHYDAITAWMTDKIHRHGAKFTFPELVERATGSDLQAEPYLTYLTEKYSDIYGL